MSHVGSINSRNGSQRLTLLLSATVFSVIVAACGSSADEPSTSTPPLSTTIVTTTLPVTTTSPAPTTVAAPSPEQALSIAYAYFGAYNAGDPEAVMALFTPDANFSGDSRTEWEQLLVWNAAQGTILNAPDCSVSGENSGDSVRVSCPHSNLDVLVQAVDGPPVPIRMTLVVTADGIREWIWDFGSPDFNAVGIPFASWMSKNHPEDLASLGFANWTTVEEAEQNGLLTAEFAAEWAAYLEANDCTYLDGC